MKEKIKKEKKQKEKTNYSNFSNTVFSYKWTHKMVPGKIGLDIAISICSLLLSLYSTYLSKFVLDTLARDDTVLNIMLMLVGICVAPTAVYFVNDILYSVISGPLYSKEYRNVERHVMQIQCDADYEIMEDPKYKTLYSQYWNYCYAPMNSQYKTNEFIFDIIKVIIFGTLLSTLHWLIFVGLVVLAALQYLTKKPLAKFQRKMDTPMTENDRRFRYSTSISRDYQNAKEVRIYGMQGWLGQINDEVLATHRKNHSAIQNRVVATGLIIHLLNFLRDAFAYIYLIMMFADGNMTPGNFVLYFTAITTVSSTLNGFAENLAKINEANLKVDKLREMQEWKLSKKNSGDGRRIPQSAPSIEFRNIFYKYPEADDDTLKNINFKINAGEKLAIVGVNGAGKTTLIKLMCGLYTPTNGEIYLDGHPISEYNIYDYYTAFSAVFQEVNVIPYSIAEHIAATTDKEKIDRARVLDAIERAGLKEKIEKLENGIDTLLDKEINDGGIDLSGGEKQKLSLARAIYLARPVLVLDEPTSALDPIAENEMYVRFDKNTHDKTSVFISHRLASTHFCDKIIHLDNGRIIEEGTHAELMKKGGKYKQMYDVQSSYYKDGKEDSENE